MKTVAFHNLGCKVNDYETDIMQQKFTENGFQVVPFNKKADVYVINTCTVTNMADRKSRQMLHRAKALNPDSIVVAVGCYVQTATEDVLNDNSVDIAIGNNRKTNVVELVKAYMEDHEPVHNDVIDINHTNEYEPMFLTHTAERTRAYIKIQDGCNQFCSYCLIPYARGRVRSRDKDEIIREITCLSQRGYKEFVLTGIHVSSYGITDPNDLSQNKLADLLEAIEQIKDVKRIRLSSLEPRVVTPEFAARISKLTKLCPHFHLSLQSGCDATLKRMNRHYSAAEYKEGVELLRKHFDDPAITTDVICGFPGETPLDFEESFSFCKDVGFYEMHVFPYSKRHNTVAEKLPNQVKDEDKKQRSARLISLADELTRDYRVRHLGSKAEVLFEDTEIIGGVEYRMGHTREYIPVAILADEAQNGEILTVKLEKMLENDVVFVKR